MSLNISHLSLILLFTIYSTIPKVKEKDYVVPFIAKNVWRTPATSKKNAAQSDSGGSRSKETSTREKTEEELQLDREAAEAVLRGKGGERGRVIL